MSFIPYLCTLLLAGWLAGNWYISVSCNKLTFRVEPRDKRRESKQALRLWYYLPRDNLNVPTIFHLCSWIHGTGCFQSFTHSALLQLHSQLQLRKHHKMFSFLIKGCAEVFWVTMVSVCLSVGLSLKFMALIYSVPMVTDQCLLVTSLYLLQSSAVFFRTVPQRQSVGLMLLPMNEHNPKKLRSTTTAL